MCVNRQFIASKRDHVDALLLHISLTKRNCSDINKNCNGLKNALLMQVHAKLPRRSRFTNIGFHSSEQITYRYGNSFFNTQALRIRCNCCKQIGALRTAGKILCTPIRQVPYLCNHEYFAPTNVEGYNRSSDLCIVQSTKQRSQSPEQKAGL